jgi:hypothetical protein
MGFDDKQGTPVATECGGSFFCQKNGSRLPPFAEITLSLFTGINPMGMMKKRTDV